MARQYHRQSGSPERTRRPTTAGTTGRRGCARGDGLAAATGPVRAVAHCRLPCPPADPGRCRAAPADPLGCLARLRDGGPARGPGYRLGDHHRARDDNGRGPRPADDFLAGCGSSPTGRRAADLRRDHHRLRTDRHLFAGALRRRAGPPLRRQGDDERLRPSLGRPGSPQVGSAYLGRAAAGIQYHAGHTFAATRSPRPAVWP